MGTWLGPSIAAAQTCVPECRTGFVCASGTCVSACNPPCAASETCSAKGECLPGAAAPVAPPPSATAPGPTAAPPPAAPPPVAPSPAPPPGTPPGAPPPGYGPAPVAEPPPPQKQPHRLGSVAFVPRLMLGVFGSGEIACDGSACGATSDLDYDHQTDFGIGADVLFQVGSALRLGPGIAYLPEYDIEPDVPGANDFTVGSDLDVSFVIEAAIPVSPQVWIVPRGQLGVKALMPSGDLEDVLDATKATCESGGLSGCDSLEGARPGVQLGLGVGVMFPVSPSVRLRGDAMFQYYKINLYTIEGGGLKAEENVTGSRGFLMAGAEF
ncbi:MAG: hypothetical protein L6Q84_29650 [Polyangiaceae bacterium]|nr:hypothetical protein [Polyangiaceae bacterium]